jgi:hypothetical protein
MFGIHLLPSTFHHVRVRVRSPPTFALPQRIDFDDVAFHTHDALAHGSTRVGRTGGYHDVSAVDTPSRGAFLGRLASRRSGESRGMVLYRDRRDEDEIALM